MAECIRRSLPRDAGFYLLTLAVERILRDLVARERWFVTVDSPPIRLFDLDVSAADSLVILELSPRRPEGVPQCDVRALVRGIAGVGASDDNVFARYGDVDLKVEQASLLVMRMMRCVDDNLTACDLTAESLQLPHE